LFSIASGGFKFQPLYRFWVYGYGGKEAGFPPSLHLPFTFQGLAIGNGLTEPSIQFNAYADFALAHNLCVPCLPLPALPAPACLSLPLPA
jgi:hypothetical protein